MGYKKVCFHCKKAFSICQYKEDIINLTCANCGNKTILFNHKFRPPKQNAIKEWALIEFLKNNGFIFQHVYKQVESGAYLEVEYPKDLEEAKAFVETYKSQAYIGKYIF